MQNSRSESHSGRCRSPGGSDSRQSRQGENSNDGGDPEKMAGRCRRMAKEMREAERCRKDERALQSDFEYEREIDVHVMLLFSLRFRSVARAGQALQWRVGRRMNRAGPRQP